ncbi:TetR/AcrR family transcriptional regulator [Brachybacterium sp. FME24]|uniref:TetR/AcrR family transcriptional regulator n=1 Tax=Brachybacterium sp. FME24 TaxID=2742605 RepID=UPI001868B411|nr:TetR/AcrR family transcriptional regulator [Brachybacterium sp. FME24]
MSEALGAWEQRKLAAMRRIQQLAMDLFDEHGYQKVTIEGIARAAGVSPSSIYRYFGTKEQVVLWDDHDQGVMANIAGSLGQGSTLSAVQAALGEVAAGVDSLAPDSRAFVRRRILRITNEPAIWDAMRRQADDMTAQLQAVLEIPEGRASGSLEARVISAAIAQAVLISLLTWAEDGSATLGALFARSFRALDDGLRVSEHRDAVAPPAANSRP